MEKLGRLEEAREMYRQSLCGGTRARRAIAADPSQVVTFKLDENLPLELVDDIRHMGHDAGTVASEGLCGAHDSVAVKAALSAGRVLMTLDKGIANLARYPVHAHAGVVLFRPDSAGCRAVRSLRWLGCPNCWECRSLAD